MKKPVICIATAVAVAVSPVVTITPAHAAPASPINQQDEDKTEAIVSGVIGTLVLLCCDRLFGSSVVTIW